MVFLPNVSYCLYPLFTPTQIHNITWSRGHNLPKLKQKWHINDKFESLILYRSPQIKSAFFIFRSALPCSLRLGQLCYYSKVSI